MDSATLLYRHVDPVCHIQGDRVTSQLFRPMPKDGGCLSVDKGEILTPKESYDRFVKNGFRSIGILGVTVGECEEKNLEVREEPIPKNPDHTLIDYSQLSPPSQVKKVAAMLKMIAEERGWLYSEK